MKTLNYLACLLLCLMSLPMWAVGNGGGEKDAPAAALFSFDEAAVYQSVEELTALEGFVKANEGTTLSDLQEANHNLVAELTFADPAQAALSPLDGPLGIPSFIWGFCLGIIGLAVVYFVTEDTDETKKALWGCIISSLIGGVAGALSNL